MHSYVVATAGPDDLLSVLLELEKRVLTADSRLRHGAFGYFRSGPSLLSAGTRHCLHPISKFRIRQAVTKFVKYKQRQI